ncbi:MAG: hypothetical protein IJS28_08395 [Synergistaceae bacterium]|nr:hypothetical protein [Synergistaceae bacterium]
MLTLIPALIGNPDTITLRELCEADIIACEDTRTSGVLLRHYGIDKPLTCFYLHKTMKLSASRDIAEEESC